MARRFAYEVFVSYSSGDKAAVDVLSNRLRSDGLRVWLDDWAIRTGDPISLSIHRGLEQIADAADVHVESVFRVGVDRA